MHIAEVVTIAKSLPLLRLNTYKSLILSYSADYRRILLKKESQAEEVNPERLKEELADVLTYSLLLAEKHWTSSTLCWKKSGRTGRNIR